MQANRTASPRPGYPAGNESHIRALSISLPVIALQKRIVYGPVQSRRLGRSLGINLLSTRTKVCTFNCLYCQYGMTKIDSLRMMAGNVFPSVTEVVFTVENALRKLNPKPDFITFSGNGEPTLHPDLPALVNEINSLRDRLSPQSQTAVLSNSSRINDDSIRHAIMQLDRKIMKFDSGSEAVFQRYNLPCLDLCLADIVENLKAMKGVTLQSLFSGGQRGNNHPKDVEMWLRKVKDIKSEHVQIYTLARGYPSRKIHPLHENDLNQIKGLLDGENIDSKVYL